MKDKNAEGALDVIKDESANANMFELIKMVPDIYDFLKDPVLLTQGKAVLLQRAEEIGNQKMIQSIMTSIEKKQREEKRIINAKINRALSDDYLEYDKNGLPVETIQNFYLIMKNSEFHKSIRFNVVSGKAEILRLESDGKETLFNWSDTDDSASQNYIEEYYHLYSPQKHAAALRMFFRDREYNPILNLIEGLQWDKENRIEHFLTMWVKADDSKYTREVSRLIFAGGINRLYNPGCKFDDVPVLVGVRQGEGKSTLIRWLALNEQWFTEVKKVDGPDSIEALFGAWICEIPELSAFKKADDVESIKAYVTRTKDKYRKPYDKNPYEYPRRCIFIGTTNNEQFLTDKTGNRRFYPVVINSIGYDLFDHEEECKEYIRQCWAEAKERFKEGKMLPFADRSLLDEYRAHQESAMEDDWRVGAISGYLEHFPVGEKVCAIQIYRECVNPDGGNPPKIQESRAIGQIMSHVPGWEKCNVFRTQKYGKQKGWVKTAEPQVTTAEELPF